MSIFGKRKLNILVLGADGMLGYDVYEHFKKLSLQKDANIGAVTGITLADGIDVCHRRYGLGFWMQNKIHYDWCINCIAFTDTWKAEHDAEGKLMSYKLNALAPKYIAKSCNHYKTKLIHISTDYVFSEQSYSVFTGTKADICTEPCPKNNYGMHKLLGEKGIAESFKSEKDYAILRTSWLYGMHNCKSFVHKFMKNVGKACKEANVEESAEVVVDVTSDEYSVPTSTECVINCIDDVIENKRYGVMHAVPFIAIGDEPPSRLDFAKEILAYYCYGEVLFGRKLCDVVLNGTCLPADALQPSNSAMASSFSNVGTWEWNLRNFMAKHSKKILEFTIKEN